MSSPVTPSSVVAGATLLNIRQYVELSGAGIRGYDPYGVEYITVLHTGAAASITDTTS